MGGDEYAYDPESLPDLLPIYYKKLFPYGQYYRWLHYGGVPKNYFNNREFSFTLKDDVYLRYQSFSDQQDLEKEIQKRCPYKIDIGAVFTFRPKEHKTIKPAAFQAEQKELVFDIDMTDYDDVRFCCSGADICKLCWPLMTIAIKIIDTALREDFGFEHILWVYSGRRGIHCWVCDEVARQLSQNGRTAVAEYLNVVKGGENQVKKVTLQEKKTHPSILRAIEIIEGSFDQYAIKLQDFMGTEEKIEKVLALVNDPKFKDQIDIDFKKAENGRQRWKMMQKRAKEFIQLNNRRPDLILKEVMLQYCYPRLDINVSKGINHLLKSPFCIHPKTGRVCVPINPEKADEFDPFEVPTISQICDELDNVNTSSNDIDAGKRKRDYRQTSLQEPVAVFESFVKKMEKSWRGKLIEESDKTKDF